MVKQIASVLLFLCLPIYVPVAGQGASFLPGGLGNCTGAGNLPDVRYQPDQSGGNPFGGFGTRRHLQTNIIDVVNNTFEFTDADIATCCTGNGDFEFLKRYLQIGGLAEDDEPDGFDSIPGNSLWTCTRACRTLNTTKLRDECNRACNCRQNCPVSDDCITQDCKVACQFPELSLEQALCIDECDRQCGERCRSTFNGYVVPYEIYGEALKILDCFYGDLIGDQVASCEAAKEFWESTGHACYINITAGLDCQCIEKGTCYNEVFPCPYIYHCTSDAPSLNPSSSPSDVPSYIPSMIPSLEPSTSPSVLPSYIPSYVPSIEPTENPTPRPTKGKGKRWTPMPSSTPSTRSPTKTPTKAPSKSAVPTGTPSKSPSRNPSSTPAPSKTASSLPTAEEDDDEDDDEKEEDDDWKGKDDDDDWKKEEDDDDDWKKKDDDYADAEDMDDDEKDDDEKDDDDKDDDKKVKKLEKKKGEKGKRRWLRDDLDVY